MDIVQGRLGNQHIARSAIEDPADVVRSMGAIQAQDYLGALWGVGLRCRAATEASVEAAIARRAFVRTWPMRGTLHFVAAADVRWMSRLLTPRVIKSAASRYRQLDLDAKVFHRAARVAERALAGGQCLTREAIYQIWNSSRIATKESRGLHILGYLAMTGLICFGPRAGKQQTFTLLDEWLPSTRSLARDESLGELARRYFTGHGPATVHDFAWWSGLPVTEAHKSIELARRHLEEVIVDDRSYWFAAEAPVRRRASAMAHLLPPWDEYTVAYRDRSLVLDPVHATKLNAGGGILKPVVVVRGRVVGTWQRKLSKKLVVVTPRYFGRLQSNEMRAVKDAVRRYGEFLGVPARMGGVLRGQKR